jgi:hypothetical protein
MTPRQAKFWAKILIGDKEQCWPWTGYTKPTGHGLTSLDNLPIHASRKAWILTHGPIRDGLCVNHRCDNPACCNPDHMYLGTRADNMMDLWLKTPPELRGANGRKRVLTDAQLEQLWKMRRAGALLRECADEFNIHLQTVRRYITERRKIRVQKLRADRLSVAHK